VFIEVKDDGDGDDNWTTGAISRTEGKNITHPWTCLPQAHLGSSNFVSHH